MPDPTRAATVSRVALLRLKGSTCTRHVRLTNNGLARWLTSRIQSELKLCGSQSSDKEAMIFNKLWANPRGGMVGGYMILETQIWMLSGLLGQHAGTSICIFSPKRGARGARGGGWGATKMPVRGVRPAQSARKKNGDPSDALATM